MAYYIYELSDGRPVVRKEPSMALPAWAPPDATLSFVGEYATSEEVWIVLDTMLPPPYWSRISPCHGYGGTRQG